MKKHRGFTLIEMMIVVAIIALLATIAIPNYVNFQLRAKTAEAKANLGAIRTCQEAYRAERGVYLACPANPAVVPLGVKADWDNTVDEWNSIGFEPRGQVRYQYQVTVGAGGTTFQAIARGDLDGNGVQSTYTLDSETGVITEVNPLE